MFSPDSRSKLQSLLMVQGRYISHMGPCVHHFSFNFPFKATCHVRYRPKETSKRDIGIFSLCSVLLTQSTWTFGWWDTHLFFLFSWVFITVLAPSTQPMPNLAPSSILFSSEVERAHSNYWIQILHFLIAGSDYSKAYGLKDQRHVIWKIIQ